MKRLKKIPKFKDEDAEREFWSSADSTEYLDWSKAQKLVLPTGMQTPSDRGKRGHLAVAISIVEEDDAYVLFFDDLHLNESAGRRTWEHKKFVTTAVVPKEKLQTMNFSTDEMAGMGLTILGSLKAMYDEQKS
jgi:sucrose-6-phosphate hydrolase SacC (GH32 family)